MARAPVELVPNTNSAEIRRLRTNKALEWLDSLAPAAGAALPPADAALDGRIFIKSPPGEIYAQVAGAWVLVGETGAAAPVQSVAGLTGVIAASALKTALAIAIGDVSGLTAALAGKLAITAGAVGLTNLASNAKTYIGEVQTTGTASFLPSGYSSAKLGTGNYRVTHNLGVNYALSVTCITTQRIVTTVVKATNTFDIFTNDPVGMALADSDFQFQLNLL